MFQIQRIVGLLVILFVGQIPGCAAASTVPSGFVIINRATVQLGDLFSNIGPAAGHVVGPAPLPGQQIVVPASQRAVIAARFHLDLGTPPHHAVVIRRSGQAVPDADIETFLGPALLAAGASRHSVIKLINTQSPMVPPGTRATMSATDLRLDLTTHHFSATLVVTAPGMGAEPITVEGLALPSVLAVVATHTLQPGEVLTSADVIEAEVPRTSVPARPIRSVIAALGMQAQREIDAHQALSRRALASPLMVRKGALVELALHMPGITIAARGVALASGSTGDVIAVLNPNSQAVLQAIVRGPNQAEVIPGSVATRQHQVNPYFRPMRAQ